LIGPPIIDSGGVVISDRHQSWDGSAKEIKDGKRNTLIVDSAAANVDPGEAPSGAS
jgi:hypothetical protein